MNPSLSLVRGAVKSIATGKLETTPNNREERTINRSAKKLKEKKKQ